MHLAIDKAQVSAVAEGQGARYPAADERQAVGIPAEVLAVDDAVPDHDVPSMPESILGIQLTVLQDGIFNVLERVLPPSG